MPFFDTSNPKDVALLHDTVQEHPALERTAMEAEMDVFDQMTLDGEVALEGYDPDPAVCEESLRQRLRLAIANVISHRLRHYDYEEGTVSETTGDVTTKREAPVSKKWPRGWDASLLRYYTGSLAYG